MTANEIPASMFPASKPLYCARSAAVRRMQTMVDNVDRDVKIRCSAKGDIIEAYTTKHKDNAVAIAVR